jgi:ribonuclease HI
MDYMVFTDGSTFNNGKKNKPKYGGIGIYLQSPIVKSIGIPFNNPETTNNICELNACIMAIKVIIKFPAFNIENDKIKIYSDSQYVIKSITEWSKRWVKNGWKNKAGQQVKNSALIKKLLELYNKYKIEMMHVRSHLHPPSNKSSREYKLWYGNYMADKLATDASRLLMEETSYTSDSCEVSGQKS